MPYAIRNRQPVRLGVVIDRAWRQDRRLKDYAARRTRLGSLQQALFSYHEAWG